MQKTRSYEDQFKMQIPSKSLSRLLPLIPIESFPPLPDYYIWSCNMHVSILPLQLALPSLDNVSLNIREIQIGTDPIM